MKTLVMLLVTLPGVAVGALIAWVVWKDYKHWRQQEAYKQRDAYLAARWE